MEDCEETCWICLEGTDANGACSITNRLIKPCRCPRQVHPVCLAKWQLSNAGRSEERSCRFCMTQLPDWQEHLSLPGMATVEPVMSVHFRGRTYMIKVKPGEEGRLAFIRDVRRMLKLKPEQEFNITFECKVPGHGMVLDLKGLSSYDAAVFCAAMTAVERQRVAAEKAQKKEAARNRSSSRRVMPARASTDAASTSTSGRSTTSTSRLSDVTAATGAGLRTFSDGAVTPLAATAPPPPSTGTTARPLSMDGATSSSDIVPEALDSTSDVGLHPTSSGEAHHHPHLPSSPGVRASARAQSHFRADSHGICELEGGEGEREGAGDEASERRNKSLHGRQLRQQEEVRQEEEQQQEQEQPQTHVPWIRRLAQSLLCIGH